MNYYYLITDKQLEEMVQFALENPDAIFDMEPMDDGVPFLSCRFFDRNEGGNADELISGFWELDEVEDKIRN